jgi:hypothetical protein
MLPEFDSDERAAVIRIYRNLRDIPHTAEVVGMCVEHVRIILGEAGPHWQTGGQPE